MKQLIKNLKLFVITDNSTPHETSFLQDWRQDLKEHAPQDLKEVALYSALGATAGLSFSCVLDLLPIKATPAKKRIANLLSNKAKHDMLFLPVFISPIKADVFMSGFILATQIKDGNCITYKTSGKLNPELLDAVNNSNTVREIAAKGKPRRTAELGGLYSIPITAKSISASYKRTKMRRI